VIKTVVGSLETVIGAIADYLGMDGATLLLHTERDTHTGWDFGVGDWPCGSLHRSEGQILYALARYMGAVPVEIGSFYGCSTTHLAEAVYGNSVPGKVQAVDLYGLHPDRIPDYLLGSIEAFTMDGAAYVRSLPDNSQAMIYEDGSHKFEDVRDVWRIGQDKLRAGGLLLSHDADHPTAGEAIRAGIEAAGVTDYLIVRVEPSDCGLAIWRKGS
jgi:hypothetical protein